MTEDGHVVTVLHGARDAAERDAVMDNFRSGKSKVLITTNVLARGIDVNQVNMVINYDLPVDQRGNPDFETYLHRIGRTGRFGRTGVSIAFIHDKRSWQELDAFQKYFGVEMVKIPTRDWEETEDMIKAGIDLDCFILLNIQLSKAKGSIVATPSFHTVQWTCVPEPESLFVQLPNSHHPPQNNYTKLHYTLVSLSSKRHQS